MVSDQLIKCIDILKEMKLTIAFAEGASGGKICYNFSSHPTSEKVVLGKIVALKDHMKEYFFGIKSEVLQEFGSESAEVAQQMAHQLCDYLAADICVSVTGAFELYDFESDEPVTQCVFIHIVFPDTAVSRKLRFTGKAAEIAELTVANISEMIIAKLADRMQPFHQE